MRNRGFNKYTLSLWFSEIKYSLRAKYLGANPGNVCYFQRTQEAQADFLLSNISEGITKEAISQTTNDSTKGDIVSIEDIVCQKSAFSKGSAKKRNPYSISFISKKPKTFSACPTALLTQKQDSERLCCIFPGSLLDCKKQIDEIFAEKTATRMEL